MGFDPQSILAQKPLSKSEQIAVEHFRKNPGGRGFFSVAEIVARHDDLDEAVQLLSFGLDRHPSYSVARVYLAQLLLKRGNIVEAFDTLEHSPIPLKGNLTAQIVRLKILMLLGLREECLALSRDLRTQEFQDKEGTIILKQLEIKPFEQVRRDFANALKIPLASLPETANLKDQSESTETQLEASAHPSEDSRASTAQKSADYEDEQNFRKRIAQGFFATPITELFQKPVTESSPDPMLEPLTYARLLRRQGLYVKAVEVYQKLTMEMPANALLKREFHEACELRDAQKKIDQAISPEVVMTMEKVRKIDDRIRLLNELLNGLDRYSHEFK